MITKKQTRMNLTYLGLVFTLVVVCCKFVRAAEPEPLMGEWDLMQTYCMNSQTKSVDPTRIFKLTFLGFEPDVKLHFYEKGNKRYVAKTVKQESCLKNKVDTEYFIRSVYEDTSPKVVNQTLPSHGRAQFGEHCGIENKEAISSLVTDFRKISYEMSSSKLADENPYDIKYDAIPQCGSWLNGKILRILTDFKFPDYFKQEAARKYSMDVGKHTLLLRFHEPEICGENEVQMLFYKKH